LGRKTHHQGLRRKKIMSPLDTKGAKTVKISPSRESIAVSSKKANGMKEL
jgi:hypothetical protein